MREKEVKVLNINKDEIENKLKQIGAVLIKDEEQINIRFDREDKYLKKEFNGYLRIRITKNLLNDEVIKTLTLKKNISRDKFRINEETETEISDCEEMTKILETLGYNRKRPGYKHRISYKYEGITFEIDIWDDQTYDKPYLEIEVNTDEELERAIELLDIDRNNITTQSIDELRKD